MSHNQAGFVETAFRRLPLFKGKGRVAGLLFKRKIEEARDFLVMGKSGSEFLLPNLKENVGFDIFINGIYEPETSDYIIRHLPAGGVFLDLGANIGAITIPVYQKRKDIKMVCVEASPFVYNYLKDNLQRNQAGQVQAINKALYFTDDETLSFYSPQEKYGKGSLSPVFTSEETKVKTVRVDTLIRELGIQKVDIIKIDVEGFEYHVFKGAETLFSRNDAPDIIFEFVDWAEQAANSIQIGSAQEYLKEKGYRIFYFDSYKEMKETRAVIKNGFAMLFASKKSITV